MFPHFNNISLILEMDGLYLPFVLVLHFLFHVCLHSSSNTVPNYSSGSLLSDSGYWWSLWVLVHSFLIRLNLYKILFTMKHFLIILGIETIKLLVLFFVGFLPFLKLLLFVAVSVKLKYVNFCVILAIGILKAAADFTRGQWQTIMIPLIITILQLAFFSIWLVTVMYIFSSSETHIEPI